MRLPTLDDRIFDDYDTYTPGRDSLYADIEALRPRPRRSFFSQPFHRLVLFLRRIFG